jgi:hypothetical protein
MHVYTRVRGSKRNRQDHTETQNREQVGRFLRDRSPKRKSLSSVSTYIQKVAPYKRWRDGGGEASAGWGSVRTHTHTQECRPEIAKKNTGEKDNPTGDQRSALEKKKNQETKKKNKGGKQPDPFCRGRGFWQERLARMASRRPTAYT